LRAEELRRAVWAGWVLKYRPSVFVRFGWGAVDPGVRAARCGRTPAGHGRSHVHVALKEKEEIIKNVCSKFSMNT
jgi:hypothetical protein